MALHEANTACKVALLLSFDFRVAVLTPELGPVVLHLESMGFLKPSSAAVVTEVRPEPDDIDFIEEDPEAEVDEIIDDRPASFVGPRTWEDVEENESQRVSLSISTHAVPSNDSGEAAARLAWQAAVLESDNQDPLGLGRIDGHGLRLVCSDYSSCTYCLIHLDNDWHFPPT